MNEVVNLSQKFDQLDELWSPRSVGTLNGQLVKIVKAEGEYVWHHHDDEDELFLVVRGELIMLLRDEEVIIREGEFFIVPRGVEHKPVADEEVHIVLFEPDTTRNTGNVTNELTIEPDQVRPI